MKQQFILKQSNYFVLDIDLTAKELIKIQLDSKLLMRAYIDSTVESEDEIYLDAKNLFATTEDIIDISNLDATFNQINSADSWNIYQFDDDEELTIQKAKDILNRRNNEANIKESTNVTKIK